MTNFNIVLESSLPSLKKGEPYPVGYHRQFARDVLTDNIYIINRQGMLRVFYAEADDFDSCVMATFSTLCAECICISAGSQEGTHYTLDGRPWRYTVSKLGVIEFIPISPTNNFDTSYREVNQLWPEGYTEKDFV